MITKIPFGRTGHESSRAIFGAAALGAMSQDRADKVLAELPRFGLNHIDVAASYGDAELRLRPWLATHRSEVFLATKTEYRTGAGAGAQLRASLERMGVDQIDMIQMHNLTKDEEWQVAMGPGGALKALIQARDEGLVRFIGVTGHGTYAPAMHVRSLETFDFDSILVPYNFSMMSQPAYAADFEQLYELCAARGVAMQTIKSIALRRWQDSDTDKKFSWYRPIREPEPMKRAVDFVLSRPNLFLNTSSDATLLLPLLEAMAAPVEAPSDEALRADAERLGIEALFERDVSDDVIIQKQAG